MTAEFVTSNIPARAWLQFFGAYVTDEARAAVLAAGWEPSPMTSLFPLPAHMLTPRSRTDAYLPPSGVDAGVARRRVRAALAKAGVTIPAAVRRLSYAELA
jgi:hypothetical protein